MTAPTPDGPHLDLDAIADLEEGLTDPADAGRQRAHLDGCAACGDTRARLAATRASLAGLPAEPMPADVAARLDTALAAAGGTIVPAALERKRVWTRHPTVAGFAAAAAVAAVVGAVVVGSLQHSDTTGSAAGANSQALPTRSAPRDNFPIIADGRAYTDKTALAHAPALAREAAVPGGPPLAAGSNAAAVPKPLTRLHNNLAALNACIAALNSGAPAPQSPLLVDFATFDRKPAVLVLMPGILAGHLDVWVVGPKCNAKDADVKFYASTLASAG